MPDTNEKQKPTVYGLFMAFQRHLDELHPGARFVLSVAYGEGRLDYTNVPDADRRKKMLGLKRTPTEASADAD